MLRQKNIHGWFCRFLDEWEGREADGVVLTRAYLAEALHCHRDTVTNYLAGITTPNSDVVALALINFPPTLQQALLTTLRGFAGAAHASAGDAAALLLRDVAGTSRTQSEYLQHVVEAASDGRLDVHERAAARRLIAQQRAALQRQDDLLAAAGET